MQTLQKSFSVCMPQRLHFVFMITLHYLSINKIGEKIVVF